MQPEQRASAMNKGADRILKLSARFATVRLTASRVGRGGLGATSGDTLDGGDFKSVLASTSTPVAHSKFGQSLGECAT
jgi:hypothetical protein